MVIVFLSFWKALALREAFVGVRKALRFVLDQAAYGGRRVYAVASLSSQMVVK
jgi:hypothetical protein